MSTRPGRLPQQGRYKRCAHIVFALSAVACMLVGCASDERASTPKATPVPETTIRLAYPSEAQGIVDSVLAELAATPLRLSKGPVRVVAQPISSLWRADLNPFEEFATAVWLAPSDTAVSMARNRLADTQVKLEDCSAAFSTRPVVAYRSADAFIIERLGSPVPLPVLLQPATPNPAADPMILAGVPGLAASGFMTYVGIARLAMGGSLPDLGESTLTSNLSLLTKAQNRITHYFGSDAEMLGWLARQDGGQPVVALTTEQQVHAFNKAVSPRSAISQPLRHAEVENAVPSPFTACLTVVPSLTTEQLMAARLLHAYLLRRETREIARRNGFEDPHTSGIELDPATDGRSLNDLLDAWPSVYRPIDLTVVIDTSASTQGLKIDLIKRDLEELLLTPKQQDIRGTITVITASAKPAVIAERVTSPSEIRRAVSSIKTGGGSCVRDAIVQALEGYNEASVSPNRRALVVFADGPGRASRTSQAELDSLLSQMLPRRRILFHVVGLTSNQQDLGPLAAMTERVGGRLTLAPIDRFTKQVYPLFRELM